MLGYGGLTERGRDGSGLLEADMVGGVGVVKRTVFAFHVFLGWYDRAHENQQFNESQRFKPHWLH